MKSILLDLLACIYVDISNSIKKIRKVFTIEPPSYYSEDKIELDCTEDYYTGEGAIANEKSSWYNIAKLTNADNVIF